jgi:hypothetical protein
MNPRKVLILFCDPTRTGATSLYIKQKFNYSLKLPEDHELIFTKHKTKYHHLFDEESSIRAHLTPFNYLSSFINQDASVYIDYCPNFFHRHNLHPKIISLLETLFERVILISIVRDFPSLLTSVYAYNVKNNSKYFSDLSRLGVMLDEIARYSSYFQFKNSICSLKNSNTSCYFISFSEIHQDSNSALRSVLHFENILSSTTNINLYMNNAKIYNASTSDLPFMQFAKKLHTPKCIQKIGRFMLPFARFILPEIPAHLTDYQTQCISLFNKKSTSKFSSLTESMLLQQLGAQASSKII